MNKLLKYLIYLSIISLILGSLAALPVGITAVNIYLSDILAGLVLLCRLIKIKKTLRLIKADSISMVFLGFTGLAFISLVLSPLHLTIWDSLTAGLYLVRLIAYFSVYISLKELIREKNISGETVGRLLIVAGLLIAVLGWLQYFLYPDLRNLYYLGWDPHFKRIFSTYFDPNYLGIILVCTLIAIFFKFRKNKSIWAIPESVFVFATIMFTYSRSSFLALVSAAGYFSLMRKNYRLLAILIIIVLISAVLLPRPGGVGVQLERIFSIETRIESWQQAARIFSDHPFLGVGFNTVRYAKSAYNFPQDNLPVNHAGAGFDNSFLFIGATTGLIGLISFFLFLYRGFRKSSLLARTTMVAIISHSLFLNTLFFPWVMLWMWIILGLGSKYPEVKQEA